MIELDMAYVQTDDPVIALSVPPLPLIKPSMNFSVLFKKHVNVDVQ